MFKALMRWFNRSFDQRFWEGKEYHYISIQEEKDLIIDTPIGKLHVFWFNKNSLGVTTFEHTKHPDYWYSFTEDHEVIHLGGGEDFCHVYKAQECAE